MPDARPSPCIAVHTELALNDANGASPNRPPPQSFVERLNKTPAETRQRIERAFKQFFHGDGQEERVYFWRPAPARTGPLAYITGLGQQRRARSEGMSYRMMIAVQLDKKREFDALWNWSKTYMHRSPTPEPVPSAASRGPWVPTARRVPPALRRTAKSGS